MSDDISEWGRYKLIDQIVNQQDRIAELEAEVTRLRAEKAALGWRRVEDGLPEGAVGVVIVEYGIIAWANAVSVRHDPEGITHWLPLPPLPEESKDLKTQEGE